LDEGIWAKKRKFAKEPNFIFNKQLNFWHHCIMPTKNICTHQFVADENVAGVLVLLFFFRNKTKKAEK
jgi:hypothetical protein